MAVCGNRPTTSLAWKVTGSAQNDHIELETSELLARVTGCAFDVCVKQTAGHLSLSEHNRRLARPPGTSGHNRKLAPLGLAHAERSRERAVLRSFLP